MAGTAPQIGKLLKDAGLVTDAQIQFAVAEQKATGEKLGECLIRLGIVSDSDIARALAEQSGLSFIDLGAFTPDPAVLSRLPAQTAKQNLILPLFIKDNNLHIAVSDPYVSTYAEIIFRLTGFPAVVHIGGRDELKKLVERFYYLLEHPVEEAIETIVTRARLNPNADIDIARLLDMLFSAAISVRATDVHITPSSISTRVMFRVDGMMTSAYVFPAVFHNRLVTNIKVRAGMDIAEQRKPQDGRMSFEFLGDVFDIRVSSLRTNFGENMVLRILPSRGGQTLGLADLGFEPGQLAVVRQLFSYPCGMIFLVGPTGSGKTTSLYAALKVQDVISKNILTVEDPIEYEFMMIRQTQVNEKAGYDFASAIRTFLRQDPDVMLIGEIRDEETAIFAVRAALTGHLVLSTLHANSAMGALARLGDLGITPFLLANSLVGIISQRLVRRLCPYCKEAYVPPSDILNRYGLPPTGGSYFRPGGCKQCRGTGYLGRTVIAEILPFSKDILRLVADGASLGKIEDQARKEGFNDLMHAALVKVKNGETSFDEIERVVG
ncbi:MAG: GspE/PulE family protein [Dissulfurimicrobium hydrothermale]|uniref:GspE/PulE family protein n=1 Tax=Dissulfurimicrobium hydrothermale TaxID=1750598 RepID=UPI003C751416